MTDKLKVRKVGNSLGTILPKDIIDALHVREGDVLYVTRAPDGIKMTSYDPHFDKAMEGARRFMDAHPNALRELAK